MWYREIDSIVFKSSLNVVSAAYVKNVKLCDYLKT